MIDDEAIDRIIRKTSIDVMSQLQSGPSRFDSRFSKHAESVARMGKQSVADQLLILGERTERYEYDVRVRWDTDTDSVTVNLRRRNAVELLADLGEQPC